jgi:hypothetical protein
VTDLTDRMRTCAAWLIAAEGEPALFSTALRDAADLLLEASNAIEGAPAPLGEPMKILEPVPKAGWTTTQDVRSVPKATWTTNAGDLPAVPTGQPGRRPNRVCPQCDSRATKRVFRHENKVMLACPVCSAGWEYKP